MLPLCSLGSRWYTGPLSLANRIADGESRNRNPRLSILMWLRISKDNPALEVHSQDRTGTDVILVRIFLHSLPLHPTLVAGRCLLCVGVCIRRRDRVAWEIISNSNHKFSLYITQNTGWVMERSMSKVKTSPKILLATLNHATLSP